MRSRLFLITNLLIIVLLLSSGSFGSESASSLLIVRELKGGSDMPNIREYFPLKPDLTVGELLLRSNPHFEFHAVFELLRDGRIVQYDDMSLRDKTVLDDKLLPGDVIIFGGVSTERAKALDQMPEVRRVLKADWGKCNERFRRDVSGLRPLPLATHSLQ